MFPGAASTTRMTSSCRFRYVPTIMEHMCPSQFEMFDELLRACEKTIDWIMGSILWPGKSCEMT